MAAVHGESVPVGASIDVVDRLAHEGFERQAAIRPDAIALEADGSALSYGELNARANRLARRLIASGLVPDSRVVVMLERGVDLIVAWLAVLKAGGAYVPVDPRYPSERIDFMLADSEPHAVLARSSQRISLPPSSIFMGVDDPITTEPTYPSANPDRPGLTSSHLAYVIYTSGSTGLPKGVMVEHRNLANLVAWHGERFPLAPGERAACMAGIAFDACTWEVWPVLDMGATLVLPPSSIAGEPSRLLDWWEAEPLQTSFLVTSLADLALRRGLANKKGLRSLLIGGDRLGKAPPPDLPFDVINNYGPTETTVVATSGVVDPHAGTIHIGRPIANTSIYLLDHDGKPVPIGTTGEIHIGGAGVARGYLNRPELTAERFLADPFSQVPNARMYKTGDLARWLADGTIEFLGRDDHQVKWRGFRIEPGEIEAHLLKQPGVRETVVMLRSDRLVAYVVGEVSVPEVRQALSASLPGHMVPSAFVVLDDLPLTSHGKIDRHALPEPKDDAFARDTYEEPQGEMEATVAGLWADLLRLERVGRHDDFFALGGHSLLALRFVEHLREQGLRLDIGQLYASPRPSALAEHITAWRVDVPSPGEGCLPEGIDTIEPGMLPLVSLDDAQLSRIVASVPGGVRNIQDIYPLAPLQEGILFHHLLQEGSDPYLISLEWSFRSREDMDRFVGSLRRVVRRHDALRTAMCWEGLAEPVQVVWREVDLALEWPDVDQADPLEGLRAHAHPRRHRLDIRRAPMMRGFAAQVAKDGRHVLHLLMHHLLLDNATLAMMFAEVEAIAEGREDALPEPVPFRRFVAGARERRGSQEHEAFFTALLGDVDEPTAPFGYLDVQGDGGDIQEAECTIPASLGRRLRLRARSMGVGVASLFHWAWGQVLARSCGRDDVVFGTVLFGRSHGEGLGQALGLHINTLPVRVRLGGATVEEGVRRVHALLAGLMAHEDAPLAMAQRCSALPKGVPLFSSLLNFRHGAAQGGQGVVPGAYGAAELLSVNELSNYPCSLRVDDLDDAFRLSTLVARPTDAAQVRDAMCRALEGLVDALEHAPTTLASRIDVLGDAERRRILHDWNATRRDYDVDQRVHDAFEAHAASQPEAIALEVGEERLGYGELNARANRLARHLVTLGVRPDTRVAVVLERGIDMVVAWLATLKAGGAYVPLDPRYPSDRLAFMLDDSRPRVVLTQAALQDHLPASRALLTASVLELDDPSAPWATLAPDNLERPELTPSHLAYVIYTSGSTGQPKGVMVEHRNLVNLVGWHAERFPLGVGERASCTAGVAFDASTWEVWPTLSMGATLVLAPPDVAADPVRLLDWWQAQSLHVSFLVTALADLALRRGQKDKTSLRSLLIGGDRLAQPPPADLSFAVVNNYGPTEATVVATSGVVDPAEATIHIGRPIANASIYLLDRHGEPVPVGVAGELYVGGAGVARGYLNRAELTAERFLPDPFAKHADARMYRTGDLARWRNDGTIEFLGRNDDQVKLRGFRIELGEIEAQLRKQPGVREAAVLLREDDGEKRLVAYVVGEAEASALRQVLGMVLPEYMVPAAYVTLEALPLTANGKLDRKALPEPEGEAFAQRTYEAPQGEVEETVARLWSQLLQVEQVGRHDHFFELGGHSLLAVQLIERLRGEGLATDIRTLFAQPTLAGLAAAIERLDTAAVTSEVPPNGIPDGCTAIRPEMLPLVKLEAADIDAIVGTVSGGAANIQDIYPLAPLQEGILFHHLLQTESDPYLSSATLSFDTRERLDAFVHALQQVIARHDVLRTAVVWRGLDEPVQVVWRDAPFHMDTVDIAGADPSAALRHRADPRNHRMDLAHAPLMHGFAAQEKQTGGWLLQLLLHHMVFDHTTLDLLFDEIGLIRDGRSEELQEPVPFRGFVAQARAHGQAEGHEAFFRDMLADVEEPTAPFGLSDVQGDGSDVDEIRHRLDTTLARRIRMQARTQGVSAAAVFHWAWAQVLAKCTGRDDAVFGTVLFGRMRGGAGIERTMGLFINTLPIHVRLGAIGVREGVRQVHATLARLMEHEHAPLALAQRCADVPATTPLFSALLNYRHSTVRIDAAARTGWQQGVEMLGDHERTNYPLCLVVDDLGDAFELSMQVARPIDAARIAGYLSRALEGMVDALERAPETPAGRIDVLSMEERHRLLVERNVAEVYPETCIHRRFEHQAASTPHAIAVEHDGRQLTYTELNQAANRLAHRLRGLGVHEDDRVAICATRSIETIVGILAILKAGGGYVPLDPAYPTERLDYMLADSAPVVVLIQQGMPDDLRVPAGVPTLMLDDAEPSWAVEPTHDLSDVMQPHHLAYVIYTSGSTGRPKGVMVEHRNVTRLFAATDAWFGFGSADTWTLFHSLAFDFSVWELWGALLHGGRLVVVPYLTTRSPDAFYALLCREGVTVLNQTPSAFRQVMDRTGDTPHRLRHVIFGGEALEVSSLAQWFRRDDVAATRLINMYGITETTVHVTYRPIERADLDARAEASPIGERIPDLRTYVLDRHGLPAPTGVAGELYVGGAGVARGYLERPELTRERFLADPFVSDDGARMYRTGDVGRWREDGGLDFLGRNDHQVKLRGFRIELGEIEAALARQAGVREVAVLVREDLPGDRRLVAYVVGGGDAQVLRAGLLAELPDYMLPAAYVRLTRLPLTPNGKLDRKALPVPEGAAYTSRPYEAAQGPIEEAIASLWCELLRVERIGRRDHFFELGGHSLLAVQMMSRLRQRLGIEVELAGLFASPSLAGFAALASQAASSAIPPIEVEARPAVLPLSFAQQRLWFISRMSERASSAYHTLHGLRLRGALNESALRAALDRIVHRHEVLRTRFVEMDGVPSQQVVDGVGFDLAHADLRLVGDAGRRQSDVMRLGRREHGLPFDLVRGPLLRGRLLRVDDDEHVLLLTLHHLIADGWSIGVLMTELRSLYDAFATDGSDPLPALAVQYADYALWQRRWFDGLPHRQQLSYWQDRLADAPVLSSLPTDRLRPPVQDYAGECVAFDLDEGLAAELRALSQRHGTTLYMTLLAAWAALVGRLSGQGDVVIGSPVASRGRVELESLIGFFVNTLALRFDLDRDLTVGGLLAKVRDIVLDAQAHQDIPFEQVVEALRPQRSLSHSPIFQLMFSWQNGVDDGASSSGLTFDEIAFEHHSATFDLSLDMGEAGGRIVGRLGYASALYERDTMLRHVGYFKAILRGIVKDDAACLDSIALLDAAERRQLLLSWNRTGRVYGDDVCLHGLFEHQASATPDAVAVRDESRSLTYAELDAQANRLAHHLRTLGVGPDERVAVCLERGVSMVVALLATLKAGGAYVPLDPSYPAERLATMLADSAPRVVLGTLPMPCDVPVLAMDDAAAWHAASPARPVVAELTPSNLAYVIYTSGSTGQPKGVMNEHRGIVNRLRWMQEAYGLGADDVVLQKTPFGFDVSVWEFFWPLANGATLVMARPEGHKDPGYLAQAIREHGVTTMHFVPSMLQAFLDGGAVELPSLRRVLCSGEALPGALARRARQALPQAELHNLYGPTEAAVDVTAWHCADARQPDNVPIGRPVANTAIYLLDRHGEPVPQGVAGEIHIGGVQVARGYLNRPELTAERFVTDPFAGSVDARMYKTGDLGRWRPDGAIEFLGRNDHQVKLRGLRIELGEIEARLLAQPGVREAVVVLREDRLVAYVVGEAVSATLREALSRVLPEYMLPSAFVSLAALPLTANGKLDRKALPAADGESVIQRTYEAPQGETEVALATLWSELLRVERVGRHDHFFELGGHSLLATQLIARIRQERDLDIPLTEIFSHPILTRFARVVVDYELAAFDPEALESVISP